MKIKDTPLVTQVTKDIKIPCSDGSGLPKTISVEQVKENLVPEAPKDGKEYIRKNGIWSENNKQDTLVSGQNIKSVDGESLLGSGNVSTRRRYYKQLGATYNSKTGYYEYGGLTDITEDQMHDIYSVRNWGTGVDWSGKLGFSPARVLPIHRNMQYTYSKYVLRDINMEAMFRGALIEIIDFPLNSRRKPVVIASGKLTYTFDCKHLKRIGYVNISKCTQCTSIFTTAYVLEEVYFYGLAMDMGFDYSPLLSVDSTEKSSVGYLILNAIGGSSDRHITITLHPDVYAKTIAIPILVQTAQDKFIDIQSA